MTQLPLASHVSNNNSKKQSKHIDGKDFDV